MKVAVLSGGRSSEHDVSLASGASVRAGLSEAGHTVLAVEIDRAGVWWLDGEVISATPGEGLLGADVAFPALHGPFGEDGTVQGLLESVDVAYVGSDVRASSLCIDKVLFKDVMGTAGVPQVDYVAVTERRWRERRDGVRAEVDELGLPVFVKPARLGSSVGIVPVTIPEELDAAVEQALAHDPIVIVEARARGIEVECSVLDGLERDGRQAPATASEPGEIVLAGGWYDYEAKYTPGGMELRIPARISASARARVEELAVTVFDRAGCSGLARVDFFVDGETVLVNELNTMPGFTETSVYSKLWEASGIGYPELVDRLCVLALERHARDRRHSF